MPKKKQMHIARFLMLSPTYHSLGMWRHPHTAANYNRTRPELYQHIAQVFERGKFDRVFFADVSFLSDTYTSALDPALRYATQAPNQDPMPLLTWIGTVIHKGRT